MAYLIPENLASRSDVPARIGSVAAALRDQLPDEATIWLERAGPGDWITWDLADAAGGVDADEDESEAHLAVALPWHGLLLLSVLEGGRRALDKHKLVRTGDDRVASAVGRLREANRPALEQLGERGIHAVAACVAPQVPRRAAGSDVRSASLVLFSDDLIRLNEAVAELFARHLSAETAPSASALSGRRQPPALSRTIRHKAIQAALHPELVITDDRRPPEQGRLALRQMLEPDDSEIIKVLDRQQERLARWMGDGYRVVKGVAGSGKTLVLLYRARLIAKTQPRWRVLLTCFNRVLADELGRQLREMDEGLGNVTVKNIDRLPTDLYGEVHRRGGRLVLPGDDYEGRIAACLDHLRADEEAALFDVVLVDESQDFDPHRLELAWRLLKPGRGHFVVARDAAQNVYRRPNWIPPDTSGRGRTSILDQNYRNTEEILRTALALVDGGDEPDRAGDPETDDLIISPRSALRNGRLPEPVYTSSNDEVRIACDRIEGLKTGGFRWNDIAVLCGNRQSQARYAAEFNRRGVPHLNLAYRKNRNAVGQEAADRVLVASLRLLKGLEFPIVFLSGLSEIALGGDVPDDTTARRAIYVAMTRATSHLILMVSGDDPYSRDIQKAIDRLR